MTTTELVDHVRQVFSQELSAIHDEGLRDKVLRTWVRSMTLSGATDLMRDQPMMKELRKPGIGLEHVRAVVQISLAIADAYAEVHSTPINRDVVAAGALLHDVGKLLEYAPAERHVLAGSMVRHAFSGVELALQEGLPREVLHIIAYHSIEGQRVRRTPECQIVYQADALSADALLRRECGISYAERSPYVYIPKPS